MTIALRSKSAPGAKIAPALQLPQGPTGPARGAIQSLSPRAKLRTLALPFETEGSAQTQAAEPTVAPGPATTATATTVATATQAQQALVAELSRDVKRIEVAGRVSPSQLGRRGSLFSTGCSTLDKCLPGGGYESGTVVEYLQTCAGSGATTLALAAAREALNATERFCLIVDWRQQFYPPAAAALGIDLKRVVIVRPHSLADRLWAIDQALRSPAIVAVIAEVEHLDDRAARRLQLAAQRGGGLGLLVRGAGRSLQPSWAEVQWLVRPMPQHPVAQQPLAQHPVVKHSAIQHSGASPKATGAFATSSISPPTSTSPPVHRQLQLELMRARGGQSGTRVCVQINSANGRVEPAVAATAALARTLAQPRRPNSTKQPDGFSCASAQNR
ncbi:MAG: hypothetical protein IT423_09815 [Pirellulaceae bacterium]|nr:hypothetical protein [Pirellulaceae bacterium]